jgi:hypothetical protein
MSFYADLDSPGFPENQKTVTQCDHEITEGILVTNFHESLKNSRASEFVLLP